MSSFDRRTINRRDFLKLAAAGGTSGALALQGCAGMRDTTMAPGPRVVVVGGGFGGATAAKYIRMFDPGVQVTLIEANATHTTCPGSNWVLGGLRSLESITFDYGVLRKRHGVEVVTGRASAIDPDQRKVMLAGGGSVAYDRLIVSPGIDFDYAAIEGHGPGDVERAPHAWQAGPQTAILQRQLEEMPDGGVFVIVPPPNPFRCPPGPYERVSMVAHYFKQRKPRAKIVILDPKGGFSKQGLFIQGWQDLYGYGTDRSLIEYVPGPDGTVGRVDMATLTAYAGDFENAVRADVLNLIPAQRAGAIAVESGLADDSGWCPVDHRTWESTLVPGVHVIGDSAIQAPLPKSGYAANSEAKVCAAAVVDLLRGRAAGEPSWVNTCYSLVGPDYGISVAAVYDLTAEGKVASVEGAGGLTPADADRKKEALYARSWYVNVTDDSFG